MNILNVEKVSKTFGEKVLLDKVTLGINKGDKVGVIGVNGTGKSTLLKIIAGIEEPDEGNAIRLSRRSSLSLRVVYVSRYSSRISLYRSSGCKDFNQRKCADVQ